LLSFGLGPLDDRSTFHGSVLWWLLENMAKRHRMAEITKKKKIHGKNADFYSQAAVITHDITFPKNGTHFSKARK
jgi:hypothetical protein